MDGGTKLVLGAESRRGRGTSAEELGHPVHRLELGCGDGDGGKFGAVRQGGDNPVPPNLFDPVVSDKFFGDSSVKVCQRDEVDCAGRCVRGDATNPTTYGPIGVVGIVVGELLLDLDYREDAAAAVDCNLVMTTRGQWVEVQATAEQAPYSTAELMQMMELGRRGIEGLFAQQRAALGEPLGQGR